MNTQPTALRLADELETMLKHGYSSASATQDAAAELRRLHALNQELLEALKGAFKALDAIGDEMTVGERWTNAGQYLIDALNPARAAIAKATGEQK